MSGLSWMSGMSGLKGPHATASWARAVPQPPRKLATPAGDEHPSLSGKRYEEHVVSVGYPSVVFEFDEDARAATSATRAVCLVMGRARTVGSGVDGVIRPSTDRRPGA